jgi:hypothetical protein
MKGAMSAEQRDLVYQVDWLIGNGGIVRSNADSTATASWDSPHD